jgi:hypothetical protein
MERVGWLLAVAVATSAILSGCETPAETATRVPHVTVLEMHGPQAILILAQNNGTKDTSIGPVDFALLDGDGVYHGVTRLAAPNATVRDSAFEGGELAPGGHVSGWLSFDTQGLKAPFRLRYVYPGQAPVWWDVPAA